MDDLPDGADHVLIVQDDCLPVPGFAEAVEQIAKVNPTTPVCLFLSHYPRDTRPRQVQAAKMGRRYVELSLRSFLPVVAVLWPREVLIDAREWTAANPRLMGPTEPRSDDAMLGRWKLRQRVRVRATVPSIVEHPDEAESTVGLQRMWGGQPRSAVWLADDARDYDWAMP